MSIVTKILSNPKVKAWIEDEANAWAVEFITRFLSANPAWYKPINIVLGVIAAVGTTLSILVASNVFTGTTAIVVATIITTIGYIGRFSTQFATKEKTIGVTADGSVIQEATAATRPYTAIVEQKKVEQIQANAVILNGKSASESKP
jgi:hypothetical protein